MRTHEGGAPAATTMLAVVVLVSLGAPLSAAVADNVEGPLAAAAPSVRTTLVEEVAPGAISKADGPVKLAVQPEGAPDVTVKLDGAQPAPFLLVTVSVSTVEPPALTDVCPGTI